MAETTSGGVIPVTIKILFFFILHGSVWSITKGIAVIIFYHTVHCSVPQGTTCQNCRIIIGCVFETTFLTPWNYLGDLFLLQRKYLARTMKPLQKICSLAVKMHTSKVLPCFGGLFCSFRKVSQVAQLACIQK